MIKKIVEVDRDVEVEPLFAAWRTSRAGALWSSSNRSDARGSASSGSSRRTTRSTRRTFRTCWSRLSGGVASINSSERKRATDAQVDDENSRRPAEVSRDDRLARLRAQVLKFPKRVHLIGNTQTAFAAAKLGRSVSCRSRLVSWPVMILNPGPLLAITNGFTTTFHHGRLMVPKTVNRCRISNELRLNSPFQVVRIPWKQLATLAVRIVGGFTQRIVSIELERPAEPAVEPNKELSLIELPARLVAIDLTLSRIGSNSIRRYRL